MRSALPSARNTWPGSFGVPYCDWSFAQQIIWALVWSTKLADRIEETFRTSSSNMVPNRASNPLVKSAGTLGWSASWGPTSLRVIRLKVAKDALRGGWSLASSPDNPGGVTCSLQRRSII